MRTYFPILLLLCLGCQKIDPSLRAPGTSSHLNADSTSQPNIILIVADDVGYELLTCNGGQSYETPRLDAMATRACDTQIAMLRQTALPPDSCF